MLPNSLRMQPTYNDDLEEVERRGERQHGPIDHTRFEKSFLFFSALLCVGYVILFYLNISDFWFNPEWTTDDALQQVFPFHQVHSPHIFQGDLIAETMRGYLAPLHYGLGYAITYFTKDVMMTAHYMMLVQIVLCTLFTFGTVRALSGYAPAFLAVAWLFHTRPVMQRITSGLPRGWSAVVIPAFLFMLVTKRHKSVLAVLFAACLLHPPAAFMCAVCYGLYLAVQVALPQTRAQALRPLLVLLVLSPVYIGTTLWVVDRPEEVGEMVDFETASAMPEFQRPLGRFPFLPLDPIWWDVRMYGYQPFWHRLYNPGRTVKRAMPYIVASILLFFLISSVRRSNAPPVPLSLWAFFLSVVVVYSLSRLLAFKLYVPNRHLQFPMSFFLIIAVSAGLWRFFSFRCQRNAKITQGKKRMWGLSISYLALLGLVLLGTSDGLQGSANFNYSLYKKGKVFEWLKDNTAESALIAGHPTHIDALPLFAKRRAFVTTEVTHPFYPKYYAEMKRRQILSLKAHYAQDLSDIVRLLEPEGVDYFVFSRHRFYPDRLEKERYFAPLNELVDELTSQPPESYAFKEIPRSFNDETAPYQVFRDDQSVVIDIAKLKGFIGELS